MHSAALLVSQHIRAIVQYFMWVALNQGESLIAALNLLLNAIYCVDPAKYKVDYMAY